jgi:hypothetical protein
MKQRSGKVRLSRTMVMTLILAAVALVLAGFWFWQQHQPASKSATVTPQPSASVPMGGHGPNTSVDAGPSHDATPSAAPTPVSNPSHPVSSTLAAPTGSLLSSASCSGTCTEESICDTVPGATCELKATKDGQTLTVGPGKVADGNGTALWDWSTSQLTKGNWSVYAVASLNGSTAQSDKYTLTVNK